LSNNASNFVEQKISFWNQLLLELKQLTSIIPDIGMLHKQETTIRD
jgi:hypothetical protein